jgi:hypothetical protein
LLRRKYMRKSGDLSIVVPVLPGILGVVSLVLHYTGAEFAWMAAAAAVVCMLRFLGLVFIMGRIMAFLLLPAMFLAVVTTITASFFTGPWYIILLFTLLTVYALVFLTPVILNAIHKTRKMDKA